MKVLFDTNILLDVLADRVPFAVEAALAWALTEQKQIEGIVSAVSFTNVYYIARKKFGKANALDAVRKLRDVFVVAEVNSQIISQSIASGLPDFEDAVQSFSGFAGGASHVVTRDLAGFAGGPLQVLNPSQLISMLRAQP